MEKTHVLFKGQRRAVKGHECCHCGREICRNEYYHCKVFLYLRGGRDREVQVFKSCCKGIR